MRVAPKLMGTSRRGEREPGKSDQIDTRTTARAVLREGIERFPTAFLDEQAVEIRLLCDHREILVSERTRLINRLRWNLVILDPELEAKIPSRKLDYPRPAAAHTRRLRALSQTARVRVAREQVKRITALTREAEALKRELRDLIRVHRGDNRQLNRALHVIAITRGGLDPETRAYLQRKEAEGKSRMEAMRCLKRHLVRHYHRLLLRPTAMNPPDQPLIPG